MRHRAARERPRVERGETVVVGGEVWHEAAREPDGGYGTETRERRMWWLACTLVLLPLAAAGGDAYEEVDMWSDGSASWAPTPHHAPGYDCDDGCKEVRAPATGKFATLDACTKSGCSAKSHGHGIVIVIIAALAVVGAVACGVMKCRSKPESELQRSLNRGIQQKDSLDDPSVASW